MKEKTPQNINGINYWLCPTCNKLLSEDFYYKDKRTPNGLKGQCKKCHSKGSIKTRNKISSRKTNREYMRRVRKTKPEKIRKRELDSSKKRIPTIKTSARQKLNYAVKVGKIIKPERCEECNKTHRITAHHQDYANPLDVEWLCYECHGKRSWKQ